MTHDPFLPELVNCLSALPYILSKTVSSLRFPRPNCDSLPQERHSSERRLESSCFTSLTGNLQIGDREIGTGNRKMPQTFCWDHYQKNCTEAQNTPPCNTSYRSCFSSVVRLQRPQEVQNRLLVRRRQHREFPDHGIRLRRSVARAGFLSILVAAVHPRRTVRLNCRQQVRGPSVM